MKQITINTTARNEMIDITGKIQSAIAINSGIVVVYVPHTTAAVTINEGADPDVQRDILWKLSNLVPESEGYRHMEGNSDSHVKVSLIGSDVRIIVEDKKLVLGTWQKVFFCEFDGPRTRKVMIQEISK